MLKNPVYTGRTVWNRLDFTEAKKSGGGARRRAREEWVVTDDTHLAIVDDATFEGAQERFSTKGRGAGSAHRKREYLFSGMLKCDADHGPAAMHGKARKGHNYYCCDYAARYGDIAALAAHDGAKTISIREDRLLKLVLRFFEQRIFGPLRIERLERQLRAQARDEKADGKLAGIRLRREIGELDRKIKAQIIALEEGVEPELVTSRIRELRSEKEALVMALEEVGPERDEAEDEELADQLQRVPDLAKSLADATPAVQRQVFEAFDLRIAYDKIGGRIELSATVSEAVANAFENTKALQKEGSMVVPREIAGAGFEPATFGL
jgi:site-specific DNA recombinase